MLGTNENYKVGTISTVSIVLLRRNEVINRQTAIFSPCSLQRSPDFNNFIIVFTILNLFKNNNKQANKRRLVSIIKYAILKTVRSTVLCVSKEFRNEYNRILSCLGLSLTVL